MICERSDAWAINLARAVHQVWMQACFGSLTTITAGGLGVRRAATRSRYLQRWPIRMSRLRAYRPAGGRQNTNASAEIVQTQR